MNHEPLVTVPILAYRNAHLIHQAIDSVLEQDYGNIELIISDDCSGDFDAGKLRDYVQSKSCGNITRFLVNENTANLGTVRHVNKVIGLSHGRYLKFVAADDSLYDAKVIRDFVDFFEKTDAMLVVSQCLIYDETLTTVLDCAYDNDKVHKIRTLSPQELYLALIHNLLIHSIGLAFSRTFFEKYGLFDENYRIDEDRSMWLRISRMGCPVHFMDRITTKYRKGGLSNEKTRSDPQVLIWYAEDLIRMWVLEVLPYKDILGEPFWRKLAFDYLRQYEWPLTFSDPIPDRFF
jgi:glycosyltransferase involved in cell wall biosynthesis